MALEALELTGERTLPGIAEENYWFRRHEAAYRFAADRVGASRVLDAGSGEGYGTAMLARRGPAVGLELVGAVAAHAGEAYPGVPFVQADLCALPLTSASFDAVVSLQVIEHLWDIPRFLDEIARVLCPGGRFICGTPNRLTFTPDGDRPTNPFHTVEFTAAELHRLLATRFREIEILGVFHGPRLAAAERAHGSLTAAQLATDTRRWPSWLRRLVAGTRAGDFVIRPVTPAGTADAGASLDLLALARCPGSTAP